MVNLIEIEQFFLSLEDEDEYLNEGDDMKEKLIKDIHQLNRQIGIEIDYVKKRILIINKEIKQNSLKNINLRKQKENLRKSHGH
jgi:hypothetical protein